MLILPHSCFLHVPKTGGTWIAAAIQAAGINAELHRPGGNHHAGLDCCPCPHKFRFAFVRHPVNLYRSYWQFKMAVGWDEFNSLDQDCQSGVFADFVRRVLDQYPGYYSRTLVEFVGEPGEDIEFIGRYEQLVDDLVAALSAAGETFDEQSLRQCPQVNVSDKVSFQVKCNPELEDAIRHAEREMMVRFGYQ